ncbi:hypothetical protein [Rhizobium sp. YTU87027]|uniref:hypothetical protein n=1 Tax=Rhizobium sp. YTU87027 TaxID=3417741 RepID=UPI003D69F7D7
MPRIERRTTEDAIRVIGWVDDEGNLISDVPDRFQAQFMFVNERNAKTYLSGCTLAEQGLSHFALLMYNMRKIKTSD